MRKLPRWKEDVVLTVYTCETRSLIDAYVKGQVGVYVR